MNPEQIRKVHLALEVEGNTVLSILLTREGKINRMGNGTGDPEQSGWFMGQTEEPLLADWVKLLSPELMELTGRYEYPDPLGERCELTITLEDETGNSTGFAFTYGTESDGPPEEIFELVNAAMDLSEPWWEAQRLRKQQGKGKGK